MISVANLIGSLRNRRINTRQSSRNYTLSSNKISRKPKTQFNNWKQMRQEEESKTKIEINWQTQSPLRNLMKIS